MMKKFILFAMAILLCGAFTVPVSAFDNEFGGYWRTRAYSQKNFSGNDDESMDLVQVDTRTRFYYTATINDDLKLVNEFEMDAVWGGSGYGDIPTDGMVLEIKNTYADFNLDPAVNIKMGAQPGRIARGFLFDEDFAGLTLTFNGQGISVPIIWIKETEGGKGADANDNDVDYYIVSPTFSVGDTLSINPYLAFDHSVSYDTENEGWEFYSSIFYLGVDLDADLGAGSLWFTGIYQGGEAGTTDFAAYLAAIGGSMDMGMLDLYGQVFYATGDDDLTDSDAEAFMGLTGQSYYWAEIMGKGAIDNGVNGVDQVSNGSPGDAISNIMALNLGTSVSLSEKMTLSADLWYAQLAEENTAGDDKLGTEIDVNVNIELLEGLDLDVIAAYLFADDVTTANATNEENPYEFGTVFSLKF